MLVIILCLLIPFGSISMQLPFFSKDITLSGLGFYGLFTNGLLNHIFELPVIGVASNVFIFGIAAAASYILMVLAGVAIFAGRLPYPVQYAAHRRIRLRIRPRIRLCGGLCLQPAADNSGRMGGTLGPVPSGLHFRLHLLRHPLPLPQKAY